MAQSDWEGWVRRSGALAAAPLTEARQSWLERVYASVLYGEGTGRSSGPRRTHLGTSLGRRRLGDGAGHGGADGGFL